jgi:acyl-CoA thioesterase YciA
MAETGPEDVRGTGDTMPEGWPAIRTVAMPADTNSAGDVFGGWLMCQMDLAAGSAAVRCARGRCATVGVESMSFKSPVRVGDEVTVWADVVSIGRTSMKLKVAAWRRERDSEHRTKVTEAVFTFVALDAQGNPRPVRGGDPAAGR